mmetsp:Transcript_4990/g.8457  ORF Transcript_4990/g.8457 Transcript_4990/m.8457 type:complete len:198 (+) Transcript_4990:119-712(+)|eukprot:CAMPEP_0197051234 /NCGR_PEP_ID=MMETSP1384-20130603/25949_1 /TAXON_ID=29189 /ORGANISM="Ammonia sp." /LENGTH=197 /DNA_ID=CAMNT_0042483763 /DNA_START=110 /DNA_END=703 /DNA_ORIENTATION=-
MGVKKKPNQPKNFGKTSRTPRRPFEKERLDSELKVLGEFGLKNKRELWRVQLTLAKIRSVARKLLTLQQDDPRRQFEGAALLRRLTRLGVLASDKDQRLEYCLSIKAEDFLKRRLQTLVKEIGVESVHRARVLIYQRHIRVGHQVVTSPSFLVREKSQRFINFREGSSLGGGPPGRIKRRNMKRKAAKAAEPKEAAE